MTAQRRGPHALPFAFALYLVRGPLGPEYERLRAILCGGRLTLHRGEGLSSTGRRIIRATQAALPEGLRGLLLADLDELDWGEAFAAVDAALPR